MVYEYTWLTYIVNMKGVLLVICSNVHYNIYTTYNVRIVYGRYATVLTAMWVIHIISQYLYVLFACTRDIHRKGTRIRIVHIYDRTRYMTCGIDHPKIKKRTSTAYLGM